MLGLFDSGSGGLNTARYIKETAPDVDLVYIIDRENAPYGIKTRSEIEEITKANIERLLAMRAERILIACCTASTVYGSLPEEHRRVAIPIIDAVAKRAKRATDTGHISVIATPLTVASHAFAAALSGIRVTEHPLGELVPMIDGGLTDSTVTPREEEMLKDMLLPALTEGADTLILGCTHFPSLKVTIGKIAARYGVKHVIDSARVGADELIRSKKHKKV